MPFTIPPLQFTKPMPHRLALVSGLPATISLPLRQTHLQPTARFIQLRGNILLVTRGAPTTTLSNVQKAYPLRLHRSPMRPSHRTIRVNGQSFRFVTRADATAFQTAVHAHQARQHTPTTTPYTILAPLRYAEGTAEHLVTTDAHDHSVPQAMYTLKTISKHHAFFTETERAQLIDERLALQWASHSRTPFAPTLLHAFETPETLNFVTDITPSLDLHELQARLPNRRFPERLARTLFAELILAVRDVHHLGFLYRDMRAESIMLSATGHVRLSDFSLSKRVSTHESPKLARTQSFVGARAYMSPEHLQGAYGRPADVWALGVTLYTMVEGRHPFALGTSDATKLFERIASARPPRPRRVGARLAALLDDMLHASEDRRATLDDVMRSAWMSGVDFEAVRSDAVADRPVPVVMDLVRDAGVEDCVSERSSFSRSSRSDAEEDEISSLSREISIVEGSSACPVSSWRRRKTCVELLGFGFMSDDFRHPAVATV